MTVCVRCSLVSALGWAGQPWSERCGPGPGPGPRAVSSCGSVPDGSCLKLTLENWHLELMETADFFVPCVTMDTVGVLVTSHTDTQAPGVLFVSTAGQCSSQPVVAGWRDPGLGGCGLPDPGARLLALLSEKEASFGWGAGGLHGGLARYF